MDSNTLFGAALSFLIGGTLWLLSTIDQYKSKDKMEIPLWVARLGGNRSNIVDIKSLAWQLFGIGYAIWGSSVMLFLPAGKVRGAIAQCGVFLLILMMFVLIELLKRLYGKKG